MYAAKSTHYYELTDDEAQYPQECYDHQAIPLTKYALYSVREYHFDKTSKTVELCLKIHLQTGFVGIITITPALTNFLELEGEYLIIRPKSNPKPLTVLIRAKNSYPMRHFKTTPLLQLQILLSEPQILQPLPKGSQWSSFLKRPCFESTVSWEDDGK